MATVEICETCCCCRQCEREDWERDVLAGCRRR
jgi:hypothetical protein